MGTFLAALIWIAFVMAILLVIAIYYGWRIPATFLAQWMVTAGILLDNIPERYAVAYEVGGRADDEGRVRGGKFYALACSYGEFGSVKAPGDLNWAIRRVGESEPWPKWTEVTDGRTVIHPKGEVHTYTKEDFYWDRRPWIINKIFGGETGIVYKGRWPAVHPHYYNLRLSNFRTVKPSEEEKEKKNATLREYYVGEPDAKGNRQIAGYLISWNEWTSKVLLSDDSYPFPIDGIRIGTSIPGKDGKKQGVTANILLFIRARVQNPRLYLYRNEDTLETIQNELIQHIRQICAEMTIEEAFGLRATLQPEDKSQANEILNRNDFRNYMRDRYGFSIKSASFGIIDIIGDAGKAITAPWVAQQNADAAAIAGDGEARAEASRLRVEGEAFDRLRQTIGIEAAMKLRSADVAEKFAEGGKASTVVFGFNPDNFLSGFSPGTANPPKPPEKKGEGDAEQHSEP